MELCDPTSPEPITVRRLFGNFIYLRLLTLQYWVSDRLNLEGGAGFGFRTGNYTLSDGGFGLILGAGVPIFNRGKHNLQFGVQYAPAFTDPGTVHNIGFTFGYQFL